MDQQSTRHFMNTISLRVILLLMVFIVNSQAANLPNINTKPQFKLAPNHQSTYQIEKYNTTVGEMTNTLIYHNGIINYSSLAEAKGLATLLISADPAELSLLNWPKNAPFTLPQQQSFNFVQEKGHQKNQHIEFKNMPTGETRIEGNYQHKSYHLTTDQQVWSRQLLLLLISSDFQLNPNISSNNFFIVDKGQISKYTYTVLGEETIMYKGQKLPTVKIKTIKENSNRISYAWLSKTQYYLPLIIEQYKGDDLNLRMQLTQLKLN